MSSVITAADIDDIACGAAILGSGGGGDPYLGSLMAKQALIENGPVTLVSPKDLTDDAMIFPVAIMGAPTVIVEKPPTGTESVQAFAAVAEVLGKEATHVGCFEAGGLNSMTPIVTAAQQGLPLVDGDGMGRALPELHMVMFNVDGIPVSPMALADEKGNALVLNAVDGVWAERLGRATTIQMGCSASIVLYPQTGAQAKKSMIPDTLTLAGNIGRTIRSARQDRIDAAEALCAAFGGKVLARGKVVDVERKTEAGFARGSAIVSSTTGPSTVQVSFQNEFLMATHGDTPVATVPDIIAMLDADTGEPITAEQLRFGYRVAVVALPCDSKWYQPNALAVAGPRAFGYDMDFIPLGLPAAREPENLTAVGV